MLLGVAEVELAPEAAPTRVLLVLVGRNQVQGPSSLARPATNINENETVPGRGGACARGQAHHLRRPYRTARSFIGSSIMKQADRMKGQAAPTDPVRGRSARASAARPEETASSGYQGKDLRTPKHHAGTTHPDAATQLPSPISGEQGSPRGTDSVCPRQSPSAITALPYFKFRTGLKMAVKPPTGWALPFPVAVLHSMRSRHADRGQIRLVAGTKSFSPGSPKP